MHLGLSVAAEGRRVFFELLFLHFRSSREETVAGGHAKQGGSSALVQSTVSPAITAQYETFGSAEPGLIKADKDLSPVHCSLSGRSGCWWG